MFSHQNIFNMQFHYVDAHCSTKKTVRVEKQYLTDTRYILPISRLMMRI